ncbi:MAG: alpha/beta hydrolase [Candidatus Thiodiazotropha sp.]
MNHETNLVKLPDGRHLAYAEYGDPKGAPTIYCHGFPGSRLEARLFDLPARQHAMRVIAPDRNGLGLSDPKPGRWLIDWAEDVEALANLLNIERFFLIGVSGGGPYALACAHKCAKRLNGFTLVCPLGPLDQPALLEAMRWPARINFRSIRDTPWLSNISFRFAVIPLTQLWPQWIYQIMLGMATPPDAVVLNRSTVRKTITASIREAVRQGADGVLHEMAIYTQPWGFDPAEITTPTQLWHGTADETVPILHGRALAERLPECEMHVVEGEGHFSLPIDSMEQIQQHLINKRYDPQASPARVK